MIILYLHLVSHKKMVLLRWQESEVTKKSSVSSPQHRPLPSPTSTPPPVATSEQQDSDKATPKLPAEGCVVSGRGSPLFEEFSDSDEFAPNQATSPPPTHDESAQSPQPASPGVLHDTYSLQQDYP